MTTYKKKLIEVALPLAKINAESAREKSIRHGHPSTLHLWWARRPLAAARAVLWSSLVDDPSAHPDKFPTEEDQLTERKRLFDILERLVPWEAANDEQVLAEARAEIEKSCEGDLPRILDPFAGGGSIPLEALRLGLPAYAGDLNPVAVLIQRAMLDIPHRFAGLQPVHPGAQNALGSWRGAQGLGADVRAYGVWMLDEARRRIGQYYPEAVLDQGNTATPIAWIWARTVQSPDPSWPGHVPLVRSWVLSKRSGKPTVWVEPIIDKESKTIRYEIRTGGEPVLGNVERGSAQCVATGAPIPVTYIRGEARGGRLGTQLLAVVAEGVSGRTYLPATAEQDARARDAVPSWRPAGRLPEGGLGFRVQNYGFTEWADLFSERQLLALTTLSDLLGEVHKSVEQAAAIAGLPSDSLRLHQSGRGAAAYADAITTYLAFVVDKCADFWSTICTWNNGAEKMRQTFARQAIPMTWDFAEVNPFSSSTGNWLAMVTWVAKVLDQLPAQAAGHTAQRDARARILEIGPCVISTDPPYYDNVGYADLSDFFFVWLRHNLSDVWPDECATLLTPKTEELIADPSRAGSRAAAHAHFESGMKRVFLQATAMSDPRFPATVFYAFKASENSDDGIGSTGWETFLGALMESGYAISATWPIRTEKPGRTRDIGSAALASSVVLACRPRSVEAALATRGDFVGALRAEMEPAIRLMQAENIAPVDLAQSAIGPGISIFSRYAKVVEADGSDMTVRAALGLINEVLAEVLSGEESELEPDSRFALTWFEQYGHNPGPFGDADLLVRAKNTTVRGVEEAGIVASRDGKVRLLERSELGDSWDPALDRRLTVWETTQHLIRALDSSETEAAALLARLGPGIGERARQLAYLLYGVCDRKKWSDEAGAYNMLVTAWPEIERLAVSAGDNSGTQLF